jgi:predicted oxidoreductase
MVVDLYGKQQNKIAWIWTKQMAMTSIISKKNTPRVSLCTTTKRAALQRDKRFRIQSKTKLATNQNLMLLPDP